MFILYDDTLLTCYPKTNKHVSLLKNVNNFFFFLNSGKSEQKYFVKNNSEDFAHILRDRSVIYLTTQLNL